MKAHEIMVRQVYKVKENDTVRDVIEKFIHHRISGLPVVNERNEMVAYLSDGDIMRYIGKHDDHVFGSYIYMAVIKGDNIEFDERIRSILPLNVMKIAQKKVVAVDWQEDIEQIAAILGKKRIKNCLFFGKAHLSELSAGAMSYGILFSHFYEKNFNHIQQRADYGKYRRQLFSFKV